VVLKKFYKPLIILAYMKVHHIFYVAGVIFIFSSVWYFTRQFIAELPDIVKLVLLGVSVIFTFVLSEIFRGKDL